MERTENLKIFLTPEEKEEIRIRAAEMHLDMASYIRYMLFKKE